MVEKSNNMILLEHIQKLPIGYSEVNYEGEKYGVTKSEFNQGKSYKIYAEELGGTDFISLNYYRINKGEYLKPCEMPKQKVIHFFRNYVLLS